MRHRISRAIESKGKLALRPASAQSGQQMIEFTLTFLMLVVLFMALLIMGWMFYTYATITSAAREGSRHLMAHPTVPQDEVTFDTADEETTWVVTNSIPMLDWRRTTVNIAPDVSQRVPGGYVLVEVEYTMSMPEFRIPLIFQDRVITLGGPLELRAMSRRSLD
jgi:Flp pilus assembly protein TadG